MMATVIVSVTRRDVWQVHDYIKSYLGESKQVQMFAQQFLEKRSKLRNAAKPKHEVGDSRINSAVIDFIK